MFYGFRPPTKDEVVFKIKGDLEQIRYLDHAVRNVVPGAVQSQMKDGLRHQYAELMEKVAGGVVSFVARCQKNFWLKPLGWLLMPVAFILAKLSIGASRADFNNRVFVKDSDGNYILMFGNAFSEHVTRAIISQLNLTVVSDHFPEGRKRFPKPERNGIYTFSMTVNGKSFTFDLAA